MHSIIINDKNIAYGSGNNNYGQLGLGHQINRKIHTKIPNLPPILQFAIGKYHTLFLDENYNVWSSGNLPCTDEFYTVPNKMDNIKDIIQIASGYYHYLLLDSGGNVFSAGSNTYGQLGHGNNTNFELPTKIETMKNITYICCGYYYSILIDDGGNCFTFGSNVEGNLGLGDIINRNIPNKIDDLPHIKSASAGYCHTILVDYSNNIYSFGCNDFGQLGQGENQEVKAKENINSPQLITSVPQIKDSFCGNFHSIILDTNNNIWGFGHIDLWSQNRLNSDIFTPTKLFEDIYSVICFGGSNIVINFNGECSAFGDNCHGQLGVGDITDRFIPVKLKINAHTKAKRFLTTKNAKNII
jgi:alpha-tubulin suppressor-like RCC1 family protein